jgi:hypothetical protein
MNNQPALIDNKITIFKLNPMTLEIEMPAGYVIDTPVAEVWVNDLLEAAIVLPITVDGQVFSFTFTTVHLQLFKTAYLYIKFDGTDYLLGAPLESTMRPAIATQRFTVTAVPNIGNVRVSAYTDYTVAQVATQQAAIATAQAVIATEKADEVNAAMIQVADRVPKFLDSLADKIMSGRDNSYISVMGPVVASNGSNGGTINTGAKTITITATNTGANSYIDQEFTLSVLDDPRVGDGLNIDVKVTESASGSILDTTVDVKLFVDGVDSGATSTAPALYDAVTKTMRITLPLNIVDLDAVYKARLMMKATAPAQASTTILTWTALGVNLEKYLFEDAIDLIEEAVRTYEDIKVTYDDQPVVTEIDMTGLTDVTAVWQAEIDKAITTSGKWLGRVGTPKVTAPINLTGLVVIDANGMDVNVAIPTPLAPTAGSELFFISTVKPVKILDLAARRLAGNPSHQPTWCRFDPAFVNKGSQFERCAVYNMPRGVTVDYCDGLEILDFYFGGGQFYGLRAGYASPLLTTNLKVRRSKFDTYLDVSAQVASLNGFEFIENDIFSTSGATFSGRGLDLAPGTGSHSKVRVMFNKFRVFREYGLALIAPNGSPVNDVLITHNFFDDRTPDATDASSRPIHIAGNTKNITMIDVLTNHIYTKEIGIWMDNARLVGIHQNKIARSNVGGTYAASQGIFGSNMEYLSSNNALYDLAVASSFVSSTTHTTI